MHIVLTPTYIGKDLGELRAQPRRDVWLMHPAIVNAWYSPNHNTISKLFLHNFLTKLMAFGAYYYLEVRWQKKKNLISGHLNTVFTEIVMAYSSVAAWTNHILFAGSCRLSIGWIYVKFRWTTSYFQQNWPVICLTMYWVVWSRVFGNLYKNQDRYSTEQYYLRLLYNLYGFTV